MMDTRMVPVIDTEAVQAWIALHLPRPARQAPASPQSLDRGTAKASPASLPPSTSTKRRACFKPWPWV